MKWHASYLILVTAEHIGFSEVSIPSNLEKGWQENILTLCLQTKKYLVRRYDAKYGVAGFKRVEFAISGNDF